MMSQKQNKNKIYEINEICRDIQKEKILENLENPAYHVTIHNNIYYYITTE